MRIIVSTNDGVLVDQFTDDDIGDLSKSLARADAMDQIERAVNLAREMES